MYLLQEKWYFGTMNFYIFYFCILAFQAEFVFCISKLEITRYVIIPTVVIVGSFFFILLCMLSLLFYLKFGHKISKLIKGNRLSDEKTVVSVRNTVLPEFHLENTSTKSERV